MTDHEQAWVVVFNIKRIEDAVKSGDYREMSGVKVVDGQHGSKYTRYIPIPNSPHGVNTAPDGIHVVINGKLSPTVSVIDGVSSTICSMTRLSRATLSSRSRGSASARCTRLTMVRATRSQRRSSTARW